MNKYIGISRPLSVVRGRTSNLDAKYGPYDTLNRAILEVPEAVRRVGLTVGIITIKNSIETVDEYWWKEGTSDDHLVKKVWEFKDLSEEEKDELKLYFEDLSPEEKNELKLKFEDLTPSDKLELKGAKGDTGDPLTVRKTYQTEALALADINPVDSETELPLEIGQFVSIVDDGEKNGIYRIGSIGGDGTMSLELQGKLGDLSSYAKSGGSTKTLKEVEDSLSEFANDYLKTPINLSDINTLAPRANSNTIYSDTSFGNLGDNFTLTMLAFISTPIVDNVLFQKGNMNTDGWGIYMKKSAIPEMILVIKGVEHFVAFTRRLDLLNFLSFVSTSDKLVIKVNNTEVLTVDVTPTAIATAMTFRTSADSWRTVTFAYLSFVKKSLSVYDIREEIDLIISENPLDILERDFIASPYNLDGLKGWKSSTHSLLSASVDGTASVVDLSDVRSRNYSRMNIMESFASINVLASYTGIEHGVINSNANHDRKVFDSKEIDVRGLEKLNIYNAWDYRIGIYLFKDLNGVILELGTYGKVAIVDSTIPLLTLTVPPNAATFKTTLRLDSYIVKPTVSEKKIGEKYITPTVFGSANIGGAAVMPPYYYCSDDIYYSSIWANKEVVNVLSQTESSIQLPDGIGAEFVRYRGYNVFALMADDTIENLFVTRNGTTDNVLTIHNKKLTQTAVSIRCATHKGDSHIHLSDPACKVLGAGIVKSTLDIKKYKRLRYAGWESESPLKEFSPIIDGYGTVYGFDNKPSFLYSSIFNRRRSHENNDFRARLSTLGMAADSPEFRGNVQANSNILTMYAKSPFRNAQLEIRSTAPYLDESGNIPSIPVTMNVYNNDVLVHTEIVNGYKMHRTIVVQKDWENVKINFTNETEGDVLLTLYSVMFWERSIYEFARPITSESIVAYLGDSWQLMSETDVDTYEPLYRNLEGVESTWTRSAFLSRTIRDVSGCELDLWGQGTKDSKWALDKQIFNLINHRKYSHCVVEFYWNDVSKLGDKWLGYFSTLCRVLMANGITPIVFCPSLFGYDIGTRLAEKYILE